MTDHGIGPPAAVTPPEGRWTLGRIAGLTGLGGFLLVLATLADPGITIDEPLDVRPGRTYVATLLTKGWRFFDPAVIDSVFRDNAEHPPLGRWLLGIASTLGQPLEILLRGGPDPVGLYVVASRAAPAATFGLLIGAVVLTAGRLAGRSAGLAAGLALIMMPRVFAHAHLAALDTFAATAWFVALVGFVWATRRRRPDRAMTLAGALWGLALLTKIHAWFLPLVALTWVLGRLPARRAVPAFLIWLIVGLTIFYAGWPWLWADPWVRLRSYLGTGVDRVSIRVLYFGTVFADREVPWHYPWVYCLTTVPVGLLMLAAWGAVRGWADGSVRGPTRLWIGSILFFLTLFGLSLNFEVGDGRKVAIDIPVYDGERLFLVVFPFVAVLAGQGFALIWRERGHRGRMLLAGFLACQATGVIWFHPFGLSYYNLLVGGLPGAERLGLELTYWGDAVDGVLIDRLGHDAIAGQTAALTPTLAPDQGKVATTLRLARIPLVIGDGDATATADWVLVSRRTAYWTGPTRDRLARDRWVAVRSRQGVWLSALLARDRLSPSSRPDSKPYNGFNPD